MNTNTDRQIFAKFLGLLLLIADLITLYMFIHNYLFLNFWSSQWFISISFIIVLYGSGLALFSIGSKEDSTKTIILIFGVGYILISLVLYLFWGYNLTFRWYHNGLSTFMGYFVLFVVSAGVGIICFNYCSVQYLRFPSYGYGLSNFTYICFLLFKYVIKNRYLQTNIFIGEIILLVIGALLFLILFFTSDSDKALNRNWIV